MQCKTVSGPRPNSYCKFPFILNGKTYNECTTDHKNGVYDAYWELDYKWCPTAAGVNEKNEYVKKTGAFGFCEAKCQTDGKLIFFRNFWSINVNMILCVSYEPSTLDIYRDAHMFSPSTPFFKF